MAPGTGSRVMKPERWSLRRASIRTRATAGAVAVFVVVLVVGSFGFVGILQNTLVAGVQAAAEQSVQTLAARVETDGPTAIRDVDDVLVQVHGSAGQVLASGDDTRGGALPATDGSRVEYDGEDWIIASDDVELPADPGADDSGEDADGEDATLVVGASLADATEATGTVSWLLVVGVPLVALLMGIVTWFVVGRALRPVDRLRGEVDDIEATSLDRRVREPGTHDEIDRLAITMNRMLGRLDRSQRAQRQFVSDASHELRSPLASMRQHAELARAHPEVTDLFELSDVVLAEGSRLQSLVESLLLLTRLDERGADRDESVDVDDLVLEEATRIRALGAISVNATGVGPGRVHGNRRLLGQVVRNLTDNAARHALTSIALSVTTTADAVVLTVDDDGSGIAEESRGTVFERFVRLDEGRARDAGGSGLGLAIVAATVAAHAGSVSVSESPLGGARFTVQIPAGE